VSDDHARFSLFEAMAFAPWVGVTSAESDVMHRVDMAGLPIKEWGKVDYAVARCDASVKLLPIRWKNLRTRGSPYARCPVCRDAKPRVS
jgi:hypothetical protein